MRRDQLAAKAVEALRGKRVVLVSGGWRHTVVADEAGSTYSWGWNKARGPCPAAELPPLALGWDTTILRVAGAEVSFVSPALSRLVGNRTSIGLWSLCSVEATCERYDMVEGDMRCLTAHTVLPGARVGSEHACLVLTRVQWRAQCGQQIMQTPTCTGPGWNRH